MKFYDFAELVCKRFQSRRNEYKCMSCWMVNEHCFCHKIKAVRPRHEILLLIHFKEMSKRLASNTAKLIPLCVGDRDSLFTYGVLDDELRLSKRLEFRNPDDVFVLFPTKDAITTKEMPGEDSSKSPSTYRKKTFVIIDGTWNTAKTVNKIPILQKFRRIKLSGASRARHANLRNHITDGHVSTLSALIHLFEELEVREDVIANLSKVHDIAVEHYEAQTSSKVVVLEDGKKKRVKYHICKVGRKNEEEIALK